MLIQSLTSSLGQACKLAMIMLMFLWCLNMGTCPLKTRLRPLTTSHWPTKSPHLVTTISCYQPVLRNKMLHVPSQSLLPDFKVWWLLKIILVLFIITTYIIVASKIPNQDLGCIQTGTIQCITSPCSEQPKVYIDRSQKSCKRRKKHKEAKWLAQCHTAH